MERKGFTLIELMIVMVLMGILATIGIFAFISSTKKGRDTQRKGSLTSLQRALETYYTDWGQYPADDGNGGILGCYTAGDISACSLNMVWQDKNGTIYMPQFPADPRSNQKFYYLSGTGITNPRTDSGKYYRLYARLENTEDAGIIAPSPTPEPDCGVQSVLSCNYGVSSGNIAP